MVEYLNVNRLTARKFVEHIAALQESGDMPTVDVADPKRMNLDE